MGDPPTAAWQVVRFDECEKTAKTSTHENLCDVFRRGHARAFRDYRDDACRLEGLELSVLYPFLDGEESGPGTGIRDSVAHNLEEDVLVRGIALLQLLDLLEAHPAYHVYQYREFLERRLSRQVLVFLNFPGYLLAEARSFDQRVQLVEVAVHGERKFRGLVQFRFGLQVAHLLVPHVSAETIVRQQ